METVSRTQPGDRPARATRDDSRRMKGPRQGRWPLETGSSDPPDTPQDPLPEATQGQDWQLRLKGQARAAGRRLRPVGRALQAFLGRIAPPISAGLLTLVRIPISLLIKLQEVGAAVCGSVFRRVRAR